jgi:foldase protein PrsA
MNVLKLGAVFVSLLLGLIASSCQRAADEEIAVAGDDKITAGEFSERYRAYLKSTSSRDNILLRKKILENMMNEKLMYADLRRQGLVTDEEAGAKLENIKNQAYLVAFAKSVTVDTMRITEEELMDEFRLYKTRVAARYVYGKTRAEAEDLKRKIEAGATFDHLARTVFEDPGLANNGGYLGFFGYKDMEPELETVAFSLPVGSVSDPVKLSMGYAIVKVEQRVEIPLASEYDYERVRQELARNVQEKKVMRLLSETTHRMAQELSPRYNEQAMNAVLKQWESVLAVPQVVNVFEAAQPAGKVDENTPLVYFSGGEWTVKTFIEKLSRTTPGQRKQVKSLEDLQELISGLATRDLMLQQVVQKGIDQSPEVTKSISNQTQAYFLKRWASIVQDTVGTTGFPGHMVAEYYNRNRNLYTLPPEMNVAEILVRTEAEAVAVLNQLKRGDDFAALARKKSIRLWAAKNGGELGFGSKSTFGILGDKFSDAPVGALIGPEKVDPYFGVFKILAKKEGREKTFEEAKDDVTRDLTFLKRQEVFKEALASLRTNSRLQMFEDRLANIAIQ